MAYSRSVGVLTYVMYSSRHPDWVYGQGNGFHHEILRPDISVYIKTGSKHLSPYNLRIVLAFQEFFSCLHPR